MKVVLFFQPSINGHFLEYLHHEYMASCKNETCKYVFVVPECFQDQKDGLIWPSASHISIVYLNAKEFVDCNNVSAIKRVLSQCKCIRKYCKKYGASHCFLNNLINAMPMLPLFLPKGCKVSGILYGIYRWNEAELSRSKLCINKCLYYIYSKNRFFKKVYLLNDHESPEVFNHSYHTDVFSFLPDPINVSSSYHPRKGFRESLGISSTDKVYLQLVVQPRKHPFEILEAINMMTKEELEDKVFIFTGVIEKSIEEHFRAEVEALKHKARIILKLGRMPYEMVYDLFNISDYCFALYDNTNMSSGVLGYAAYFKTKVIGVSSGLLGALINTFSLGSCVSKISATNVKSEILNSNKNIYNENKYVTINSIENFIREIMLSL